MREIAAAISRMLGFGGRTGSTSIADAIAEYGDAMTTYSFGPNSRLRFDTDVAGYHPVPDAGARLDGVDDASQRQVAVTERNKPGRRQVAAGLGILADIAACAERGQQPVRRALGNVDGFRDLVQREAGRVGRQQFQDREGPVERAS